MLNYIGAKVRNMIWNKGLTKETSETVAKGAESLREYYKTHSGTWTGKKLSEETKQKISAARKKYLSEHPDKVPFKLNHSSKESYPEKYFKIWLKKEEIFEVQELQIDRYTLDFAWPDKKIYLEIDGSQHNLAWMQEHDKVRTEYLSNLGWICIGRVDWVAYQQLNKKEKHNYLVNLKKAIIEASFIEKFISIKDKKKAQREEWLANGMVNCNGIPIGYALPSSVWQDRLELILNCDVDFTKQGWQEQVKNITGLSRRQVSDTIKHFPEQFKDVYIRGR